MFQSGRNSRNYNMNQNANMRRRTPLITYIRWIAFISLMIAISVVGIKGYSVYKEFISDREHITANIFEKAQNTVEHFIDRTIVGEEGEVETETKITVTDVIEIGQLSTLSYRYSGICPMKGENQQIIYYIAFEGEANFGIDTSNMNEPIVDDENKTITIILPGVELQGNPVVYTHSLDYIFLDDTANVPSTAQNAQGFCEQYLLNRVKNDETLWENAKNNTYSEFIAMTKPLIDMFFPDYTLSVVWAE